LASAADRLDVFDLVFALVAQKPKGDSVNILASLACFARELQCPGSAPGILWVRLLGSVPARRLPACCARPPASGRAAGRPPWRHPTGAREPARPVAPEQVGWRPEMPLRSTM
jgi:hypothetical protein